MRIADTGSASLLPSGASSRSVPRRALRLHAPGSRLVHVALWRDRAFDGWKVDVVRSLRRYAAGFEYLTWSSTCACP
jgi:hypothetical protein